MKVVSSLPPLKNIAYAQCAEDIVLLRAFRDRGDAGFYVDVGAGHPTIGSVTKNLYDRLGWSGIEIEPLPEMAEKLRAERPRSVVVEAAASAAAGSVVFTQLIDNWAMSTTIPHVAERHVSDGWATRRWNVTTRRLDDMLEMHRPTGTIDLIKIDAEGAEADVLKGLSLERWKPRVLVIEATEPGLENSTLESWEDMIPHDLYVKTLFDGLNVFYALRSEAALCKALGIGANVFDQFIHLRWWQLLPEEVRKQYPSLPWEIVQ